MYDCALLHGSRRCAKSTEKRRAPPILRRQYLAQPIDVRALFSILCNLGRMDVKAAAPTSAEVIDFFDYASSEPRTSRQRGDVERRTAVSRLGMRITDDWPACVPVTEAELDLFEAHFGPLIDELLRSTD